MSIIIILFFLLNNQKNHFTHTLSHYDMNIPQFYLKMSFQQDSFLKIKYFFYFLKK